MRHLSIEHVLQFFTFGHLPPRLQEISRPFAELAYVVATHSNNPETTVALRKLLEAKDAAVRAFLIQDGPVPVERPPPTSMPSEGERRENW